MSSNAETHHYIKNVLQSIISYSNTAVIGSKLPPAESLKKLNQFIHILSSVQDLVFAMEPLDFKGSIRADHVLEKAAQAITDENDEVEENFPELICQVKRTTNLAIILLEILSTVKRHSEGSIRLDFSHDETGRYQLTVRSLSAKSGRLQPDTLKNDLKLAILLLKSDLNAEAVFELENGIKVATSFVLEPGI